MHSCTSLVLLALLLPGAQEIPDPTGYVTDLADILDAGTEEAITRHVLDLKAKTGAELAVLTVPTTGGESIDGYGIRVGEAWQVGDAEKSNGVILVIAVDDREYRFEVGYGLEGALPDGKVGEIGRQFIVPHFREGRYGEGTRLACLAALNTVADSYGVELSGIPDVRPRRPRGFSAARLFVYLIILVIILGAIGGGMGGRGRGRGRYPGGVGPWWLWFLLGGLSGGHHRRHWGGQHWGGPWGTGFRGGFGGGGLGGGGGGGFGGFGGGSFGGGGASGSW